ncbi:MAG TPA: DUF1127 domain-containing protein [Casimicrobiaceae bacterium]|nr:DUF1127 domain-containing protein [Casimicrobiaceae bacterium]
MDTQLTGHPATAWMASLGQTLQSGATGVRSVAMRLDAWLATRARRGDDLAALAAMSDRELRDIGLPARGMELVPDWSRNLPL